MEMTSYDLQPLTMELYGTKSVGIPVLFTVHGCHPLNSASILLINMFIIHGFRKQSFISMLAEIFS